MRAADIKNLLDKTRAQAEKIRRTKVDGVFPSGHLDLYEIYNTADAADASKRILQRLGAREGVDYRVWAVPNGNSPKSWMVYSELAERFRRETGGFALVASERTYEYLLFQPDGDNVAQILAGTGISFGTSSVSAALRDFLVLLRQGAAALDAAFFGGVTDYEALAARRPLDRGRIHQFKKQFMQFLQDYRFPEALDTLQGWKNAIGQPAAGDVSWAMEHSRRMVLLVEEQYCRETESGLSKEELPDTLEGPAWSAAGVWWRKCRKAAAPPRLSIRRYAISGPITARTCPWQEWPRRCTGPRSISPGSLRKKWEKISAYI